MSFSSFEHEFIKYFKSTYGTDEKKDYFVSCSGGMDSVVLFYLMLKIKPIFSFDLKLLHINHGLKEDPTDSQSKYREEALNFCKELAQENNTPIEVFKSDTYLKTETECRDFRRAIYADILSKGCRVFLAHHKDDLFETLVMRLLRGTNLQGLASPFSSELERPLVKLSDKDGLKKYKKACKIKHLEDPSNVKNEHFRNWLRCHWLKELEKSPYGLEPFKKSLCSISEQIESPLDFVYDLNKDTAAGTLEGHFQWPDFSALTKVQKKSVISALLLDIKHTGYTEGQVLEIVKNLERNQLNLSFSVAGLRWTKKGNNVSFYVL